MAGDVPFVDDVHERQRVVRLYLVRHGSPSAAFGEHPDPPLDDEGHRQAVRAAERLVHLGPLPLITSPMLRTRETAGALERAWGTMATVEPGIGEVPAPDGDGPSRRAWVRDALATTWPELGARYTSWRTMVGGYLRRVPHDSVLVTHFFVINAAISLAIDDERVLCVPVPPGSVTVVDVDRHSIRLVPADEHDVTADPRSDGPGAAGDVVV
jgi:broad specificity phosphatase PhoE